MRQNENSRGTKFCVFTKILYNLATDKTTGVLASILKSVLLILSFIYGIIIRLVIFFNSRNQYCSKCKVISVGNITLGGTGKTPLVKLIAEYLKAHGHKPAILSRGYKKKVTSQKFPPEAGPPTAEKIKSYENMGDEPYMLKESLVDVPVLVGADRIKSMESAETDNLGIDTFILDDGFQQWKIKKDLEIVTIDAVNPFGNRYLLPRGILRQPVAALKKADIFVLTKTDISRGLDSVKSFLAGINSAALIVETVHEPAGLYPLNRGREIPASGIKVNDNIALVSGIADPDYFLKTARKLGINNPGLVFNFPDHHEYSSADINGIVERLQDKGINSIIITEKDAAKLKTSFDDVCGISVLVLRIKLRIIKNEQGFIDRLLKLYSV